MIFLLKRGIKHVKLCQHPRRHFLDYCSPLALLSTLTHFANLSFLRNSHGQNDDVQNKHPVTTALYAHQSLGFKKTTTHHPNNINVTPPVDITSSPIRFMGEKENVKSASNTHSGGAIGSFVATNGIEQDIVTHGHGRCDTEKVYDVEQAESTESSLPHAHYPKLAFPNLQGEAIPATTKSDKNFTIPEELRLQQKHEHPQENQIFDSQSNHAMTAKDKTYKETTGPTLRILSAPSNAYSTPCTTTSFEDIPSAFPVRSAGESSSSPSREEENEIDAIKAREMESHPHHQRYGYARQISENSLVSRNSLGANSIMGGSSFTSNSLSLGSGNQNKYDGMSAAQSVLELSNKSLADELIPHEDDGEGYSDDDDDDDDGQEEEKDEQLSCQIGGYSADQSSFTLAARPIDECSDTSSGAPFAYSMTMMELKQALPMEGESEDEDSHIQRYGFGHARDVESSIWEEEMKQRSSNVKPCIPQTFPSLLDSSMSSSYSVSMPASVSPSFDNFADVQREGSKEEREDTLGNHSSYAHTVGLIEEPLAIEVPLPLPLTSDVARYIVDLERINEESSGTELAEFSSASLVSSRASGNNEAAATKKTKGASSSMAKSSKEGLNEPWTSQGQVSTSGDQKPYSATGMPSSSRVSTVDEGYPSTTARRTTQDQYIHRHPHQFYNYRHQYYTEQYHYFDGDKYPQATKGDDDTESTCSSVTLSQAFQQSVQGDDDSCTSSSYMAESTSHPSYSTVSSVTLSHALFVDRHDHSGQGFYVATRLGDYVEVPNDEPIVVETVKEDEDSCVEERDVNEIYQKQKSDAKTDNDTTGSLEDASNNPSVSSPGAATDVVDAASNTPAAAGTSSTKQIAQSNEGMESDILNMLIPECGVPIPSVMAKMGKQKSKGGMLLPWHSTRSIQNYQYGGGRRKKKNMTYRRGDSSIFSISSVHTFRG
ncbi:hypothetical protein HJC23_008194 [Cyclotella cryptica]|uniref:Uncharacterized protein n=1 Tax=Cyclotella cryptica TaxID=29204 RepID=A0ABD3PEW4_9STRA